MHRLAIIRKLVVSQTATLRRDRSGVAAIEFAMIAPIMLMLYMGTVEFSQALTADRRVAQMASTTADLVAQYDKVPAAQIANIFKVSKSLLLPYPTTGLEMSVTNLKKIGSATPSGNWSKDLAGASPYLGPYTATVPPGLLPDQAGSGEVCVVMAEVKYLFKPTIGYFLSPANGIQLNEKFYLKPRKSTCVDLI
jgi:Flp pilus assembly protein TadG